MSMFNHTAFMRASWRTILHILYLDIINFKAHMMHPALRVLLEELGNRGGITQGLEKLQLGVIKFDKDDGDTMLWNSLRLAHFSPQDGRILLGCSLEVRHGNRNVVKSGYCGRRLHPHRPDARLRNRPCVFQWWLITYI